MNDRSDDSFKIDVIHISDRLRVSTGLYRDIKVLFVSYSGANGRELLDVSAFNPMGIKVVSEMMTEEQFLINRVSVLIDSYLYKKGD